MKMLLGGLLCSFLLLVSANSNYGREVHVENTHSVHRDNSIRLNNANFGGSSNVVIGRGNVVRGNGGFNNREDYTVHSGDGKTYTYSERHTSKDGLNVKNVHTTYTDNSIHRNGANFEGARNVVIGNNKILTGAARQMDETRMPRDTPIQNTEDSRTEEMDYPHSPRLSKRDTYPRVNGNNIRIKDLCLDGSVAISIGHHRRHKKDVEQNGEKNIDGELSRVKRWSLFGVKSKVENHHSTNTDNSIHANGANFGNSQNVVIGHGNRLSKRSIDGEQNVEVIGDQELSRQKRWGLFGAKSNVQNHHHTHTDNSIHVNNANFGNSQGVVIGHGNRLSKRSAETFNFIKWKTEAERWTPQECAIAYVSCPHPCCRRKRSVDQQDAQDHIDNKEFSRQKRWSFKLKSDVKNTHTEKIDNSIHANGANFGNSQNVVIGHGNHLSKRSVDVQDMEEQLLSRQENVNDEHLSRQKRWGFGLKSGVGNSHSTHTDNSIHMNHANFGRSQNVIVGHGNHGK